MGRGFNSHRLHHFCPAGKNAPPERSAGQVKRHGFGSSATSLKLCFEPVAGGQITLDRVPVTTPELKTKLAALKTSDPELGVVVKGADDTDYQIIVNVLDTLRQLDITKMGMATE